MPSSFARFLCTGLALALVPSAAAHATDGHFLHGVGAVNASMGGAGVAAPADVLGAFYMNPAGLMTFGTTRVDIGFEMFKPERTVASSVGPMAGATRSSSAVVPIPALGFSTPVAGGRAAVGLAALGVGGFGVNYPADPTNPVLAPRPYGFGQVASNFQLLKIAPGVAVAVTDRLWLGAAANIDWAYLTVDPFPVAAPAADPGPDGEPRTADDRAFYSAATATDGAFGAGFQAGAIYAVTPTVSVGVSYTSAQRFREFVYNSSYANPNRPDFGAPRELRFTLDAPAVYAGGISVTPVPALLLVGDVRRVTYARTRGFRDSGFTPEGAVRGFGWRNITVLAAGAQFAASPRVLLRAGYNYSGNPVRPGLTMFNVPAPAIVQHHLSVGGGLQVTSALAINAAYYHAFENSITGSLLTPAGPVPGSSVTSTLSESSLLLQFTVGAPRTR